MYKTKCLKKPINIEFFKTLLNNFANSRDSIYRLIFNVFFY